MSIRAYETYRDSGVEWLGVVPSHWRVQRLKRLATVFPSNIDKKTYDDQISVRLCNYTDVYYNETITDDPDFMAATATAEQIEKFTLRAGDTIITKDSETADDIAIAAYVPKDLPGVVCGYHLSMVRPMAGVSGAFLKRFFDSSFAKASFAVCANGLTRVGLGQYAVDNVDVPVPPAAEQSSIAAFLDREAGKIDALVEAQRRLIELLTEKRQAVISHAVTKGLDPAAPMKDSGVEWLGEVPAHWQTLPLRRIIDRIEQGWSPECESRPAEVHEWGVLKAGCVNGGFFSPDQNKALPASLVPIPEYEVHVGDVLMSRANGSPELVGSIAYIFETPSRIMLSDKIFRIVLGAQADPRWFVALFGSLPMRAQITQAISGAEGLANNLPQARLMTFLCALPPLDEQRRLILHLDAETQKFDALAVKAKAAITLLQERRSALISAAITGKIDVRALAPAEAKAA